jgi:glycosyltransferase involved in cell wall biosynthesis
VTIPRGHEHLEHYRAPVSVLEGDAVSMAPTAEELEQPIVAPGRSALLPLGVVYQAGWEPAGDGLARHARACARALSRAGVAVSLTTLPVSRMMLEDEIDEGVLREVGYLRATSISRSPVAVRHIIIHSHQFLENVVVPKGARLSTFEDELKVYRSTIVYTSWERSTVHPEIVEVLNRCGRVWVPCRMNRHVFQDAGVKNVDVIPYAFDPDTSPVSRIPAPRGSESVPAGKRFYAIGKWEPRKNYDALIGAFLLGFTMKDQASLIIKTSDWGSWKDYPTVKESLDKWLSDPAVVANGWTPENRLKRLRIVTKKVTDQEISGLHRDNNIYVTCSHGEAWDLPAFDARVAGNRLVYKGWGGASDYASPKDHRIFHEVTEFCGRPHLGVDDPATSEPVHPGYGWEPGARWAICRVEDIREALRMAGPPETRVLPTALCADYAPHKVGELMLKSISSVISDSDMQELLAQGSFG